MAAAPRNRSYLGVAVEDQAGVTISSISGDGSKVTVTTSAAHNVFVGSVITLSGVTPSTYNGTYVVTDITTGGSNTFKFVSALTTTVTAVGSYTVASGRNASDYIPVKSLTPLDSITVLEDQNWRGSMVDTYNIVQGPIHSEFEFAGDVFADTIGYPLVGMLGAVSYSGSSAPYTANFSTLNTAGSNGQPYSLTLHDYYGGVGGSATRAFSAQQMESLEFKFNADSLFEYTAKAKGRQSVTVTDPTPSFSSVTPVPSWTGTASIGGTSYVNLTEGTLSMKRPVNPIFSVNNTQAPYQLFAGPLTVDGSLMFVWEQDDVLLNRYLNNTQGALVLNFTQGTGASLTQVQFTMSNAAFTVGKIERGKDYVEANITFKAIANATDKLTTGYSPIKVVLQNAKATSTYGAAIS